jgi:predicted dienelactone hydrolase
MVRLYQTTRLTRVGLATLLCWILGLIVWLDIERTRPVTLPAPTGPYAVGRAAFDWIDEARSDSLIAGEKGRELVVWVWYPANSVAGTTPTPYMPPRWSSLRDQGIQAWIAHRPETVSAHAMQAAPVAATSTRFPLLLFEPGLGNDPVDYTALLEELASHGYVVAGIFPTGSTSVRFADGRVVPTVNVARDQQTLDKLLVIWVADTRFALDRLVALHGEADDPLAGMIDLDRVGFLGHSFGGATAAEACRIDARCKAAANLDGALFGTVAQGGLPKPYMLMTRDNSRREASRTAGVEAQRASVDPTVRTEVRDHVALELLGFGHLNFADSAVTYTAFGRWVGVLGAIDGRRGLRIAATYIEAFFDHTLSGVESPLLQGLSPLYPEVRFIAPPS